jgi:hypothetical protein
MVFDLPTHKGTYTERYNELGKNNNTINETTEQTEDIKQTKELTTQLN